MRREIESLKEYKVVFYDLSKWITISVIKGAVVGFSVSIFLLTLEFLVDFMKDKTFFGLPYFFFLPFAMGLSAWMVYKVLPEAEGDGTEDIVRDSVEDNKRLNFFSFSIKQFATLITIVSGGSAGKEAPSAQIGSYISLVFARILKFSYADRILTVITGVSAGFAVVFGAPIAGALFALEALFSGRILYRVCVPAFISAFIAFWAMKVMDVSYIYKPIKVTFIPNFWELANFMTVVISGVFFGLISYLVIIGIENATKFAKVVIIHPFFKGLYGGTILVILALIFGTKYLGLGLETISLSLTEEYKATILDPLLKILFTSITLGFGGSGGFVTPILFVGSTAGNFFGHIIDGNIPLFAALGFVAVLSGSTNSPIASTILAAELFGSEIIHFAAVASIISYIVSSKKSVFSKEVIEIIDKRFRTHYK